MSTAFVFRLHFLLFCAALSLQVSARAAKPADVLRGKKVAILVGEGFEEVEMTQPRAALTGAGAQTSLISLQRGQVRSWNKDQWGKSYPVDIALNETHPEDYDALLLPGGVMNPDHLRMIPTAVAFVKAFFDANKPVAAICHAPWILVEANIVKGRTLTSWPSVSTDVKNAGGNWVDQPVVTDGNLVTSRKPEDIPQFNPAMIKLFSTPRVSARNG